MIAMSCASVVIVILLNLQISASQHHTSQLIKHLFDDYISDIVPLCSHDVIPVVSVDMSLRSILDVDEPRQIMTANIYNRWNWTDCRLTWNSSEYGGIDSIVVSASRLWIPDITLYDSAGQGFEKVASNERRITLKSNGNVQFLSPAIIKFTCKMDVTYFPYDMQICRLKYASWSYTGVQLDVENATQFGDLSVHVGNGEWKVLDIPVRHNIRRYKCCPEPFPDVTFYFIMQRQCLYYMFNLVMPCLLITGIGLMVFLMPPETGEKMSLGITVMLSLCVFLLMVADRMPATSETIPLIGQYFASTIILISLSCAMTVVVLNVHHQGSNGRPVPRWIHKLVLQNLSKILFMKAPDERGDSNDDNFEEKQAPEDKSIYIINNSTPVKGRFANPINGEEASRETLHQTLSDMLLILREFKTMLMVKEDQELVANEWREVAVVLDRLFFIIVFISTLIITLSILLKHGETYTDFESLQLQVMEEFNNNV